MQTGLMTAGGGMVRRKGLSFRGRHLRREAFPTSRMGGGGLLTPRSPPGRTPWSHTLRREGAESPGMSLGVLATARGGSNRNLSTAPFS